MTSASSVDLPILDAFCPQELRDSVRRLVPVYYEQLKRMARNERGRLVPEGAIDTTAIVHEAYIRLSDHEAFRSREHFLRTSAIAMRYVIIDQARAASASRRGGREQPLTLSAVDRESSRSVDDDRILRVHEALERLQAQSPRLAQVAECRYFGGYSDGEIAEALETSVRTVRRDWVAAKAWLIQELGSLTEV